MMDFGYCPSTSVMNKLFLGLDVVAMANKHLDVVSGAQFGRVLARKTAIAACKFSTSSMPYSDRYNMQVF